MNPKKRHNNFMSHNPYFIGMNLAIAENNVKKIRVYMSQSLFYWNEPCNKNKNIFIGNNFIVTILILLE